MDPTEEDLTESPLHSAYRRVFTDTELFAALGLLNSIPFDFLMRTKTDTHIVMYKFEESQVPQLTEGDDWFEFISTRAAKLNCYGEEFQEVRNRLGVLQPVTDRRKREKLRAEIDAAAFHAYGFDRNDTTFILENFHRVSDPRLMDEDYFDMVLKEYDRLAKEPPKQ